MKPFSYNIILTLLFFTVVQFFFSQIFHSENIEIRIKAKVLNKDVFQIYYDDGRSSTPVYFGTNSIKKEIDASNSVQTVVFKIPAGQSFRKIRIDPGTTIGKVYIKEIIFESNLFSYVWNPKEIQSVFRKANHIDKFEIEGDFLMIEVTGGDPYFVMQNDMPEVYANLSNTPIFINWRAFPLTLTLTVLFLLTLKFSQVTSKLSKYSPVDVSMTGLFLFFIFLPIIGDFSGFKTEENIEKRELNPKPVFDLQSLLNFPKAYNAYYEDNFSFRNSLIKLNSLFKIKILEVSTTKKVIVGKESWLYYSENPNKEKLFGNNLLTKDELEKIYKTISEQKNWLENQGISFYLLIAPDKQTVYPEYLPYRKSPNAISATDQVVQYLTSNSDIHVIDLRKKLISEKRKTQVYYKNDSHWNKIGAFIGYQELFHKIRKDVPELPTYTLADFDVAYKETSKGDLVHLLGLKDYYVEIYPELTPVANFSAAVTEFTTVPYKKIIKEKSGPEGSKLIMFMDSFGESMVPYVSESFSKSIFLKTHQLQPDLIKDEKPTVVVLQIVERLIKNLLIENPNSTKKN